MYVPSHDAGALDIIDISQDAVVDKIAVAPNPHWVTFTPDSKHLFWIIEDGNRSVGRVFLDGRPVYEFDERGREPLKAPGGWTVDEQGVLTFFIQTVDGFKRVRITPGAEDGVEAFVARGRPMR